MKKSLLLFLLMVLLAPFAMRAETLTFDFEDGVLPEGWTNDANYPWAVVSDSQGSGHTGTYCLKSGNFGVNNSESTISVTFVFAGDGSISFLGGCWGEGTSSAWDKCIFSIDGEQKFAYGARDTWETYQFEVTAGSHTFTWKFTKDSSVNGTGDAFFIDNVVADLGEASACPKPTSATISNVGSNDAHLTWERFDDSQQYFQILCVESPSNPDELSWEDPVEFAEEGYDLSALGFNLEPLHSYDVYVRAFCGDGDEEKSDYRKVTFTTTAVAEEVGEEWSDDFEGALGWEFINGTLANAWVLGEAANNGGSHALYISNDGGATHAYTNNSAVIVYATKLLHFENGKYQFTYDWLCNGESTYDYLRVALVPADITLAAGTNVPSGFSYNVLPTNWIALDGGSKLNLASSWQNQVATIQVEAGNYYLVLAWRDDTSGGTNPPAAVDNVHIALIGCEDAISDLSVSAIAIDNAKISWTKTGENASMCEVLCMAAGEEPNWDEAQPVEGEEYFLADYFTLEANHAYDVYVRAFCDDEHKGAFEKITFRTECLELTEFPYNENFDSYEGSSSYTPAARVLPNCWKAINTTTYDSYKVYPSISSYSSSYAYSEPNHLRFYSYYSSSYDPQDQYAVLPAMDVVDGKEIFLYAKGYNSTSEIIVGRMTDPTDPSTFNGGQKQQLTASYEEYTFQFKAGSGNGDYIAIKLEAATSDRTTNGAYIDNVRVREIPACEKPVDFAYDNVTAHTVELSWTSDASAWEICLNGDEEHLVEADSNPFTLENLHGETAYTLKVRAACDAERSEWSSEISFTTLIACAAPEFNADSIKNITAHTANVVWGGDAESYSLKYGKIEGIDFYSDFEDSNLSSFTTTTSYAWEIAEAFGRDGGNCAKSSNEDVNSSTSDMVLDVELENDTPLSFWAKISSEDSWDKAYFTIDETVEINGISGNGSWIKYDFELTAGSHTLRWRYTKDSSQKGNDDCFYVDDITIGNVSIPVWSSPVVVTENTYPLSGLEAEAMYEVSIQSLCAGEEEPSIEHVAIFKTGIACLPPSALTVSEISSTSAKLSWTAGDEGQENWQLCINGDEENLSDINENPYVLALTPGTEYAVKVRANCGSEEGVSKWSNEVVFESLQACPAPAIEEDSIKNITGHTADVYWGANVENDSYKVSYRTAAYLDGIEETFETTSVPEGWTRYSGALNDDGTVSFSTSSHWYFGTNSFSSIHAYMNIYSTNKSWLVSPLIDITENFGFSFDVAYTKYNSTSAADQNGSDDRFVVLISNDNMEHWNILREWNNAGSEYVLNDIPTEFQNINDIDLSAYAGQNAYIAFYGASTTSDADNTLRIDNIYIGKAVAEGELMEIDNISDTHVQLTGLVPETLYDVFVQGHCAEAISAESAIVTFTTDIACYQPTVPTISDITAYEAKLDWAAGASEEAWQICINGDEEHLIDVTTKPYILTELTPETEYSVKVRANCGGGDISKWTNAVEFTTASTCQTPDGLEAGNITTHSADIAWNTYGLSEFNLRYSTDGENWETVYNVNSPYTIDELEANTAYQVQAQAICNTEVWSAVMNFRTDCEAITSFPWSENFDSYAAGNFSASCWINEHIAGSGTDVFKINSSVQGGNSTKQLQLPDQQIGNMVKLVLPSMSLPDNNYEFVLDVYRSNSTYNDNFPQEGIRVYVSTNGEIEGATELAFIPRQYTVSSAAIPAEDGVGWYTYELPIGVSGDCYIILRGESQYCTSTYVDNFIIQEKPYELLVTEAGYATYYSADDAYIVPEGLAGHAFSIAERDLLDAAYVAGNIVPANEPLVLEVVDSEIALPHVFKLYPTVTDAAPLAVNDLIGVNETTFVVDDPLYKFYVLSLNAAGDLESVGFWWYNENGEGGFEVPAHKAYLKIERETNPEAAAARYYLFHGEHNATGIDSLEGIDGTVKFIEDGHLYILREGVIFDATGRLVERK